MKIKKSKLKKLINRYLSEVTSFGASFSSLQDADGNFNNKSNDKGDNNTKVKILDKDEAKALFVGDSQTYWPGVSYANQILKYPFVSGENISKNGATLSKIKGFLKQGLSKDKYDIVTIMGGGNDSPNTNPNYNIYEEMYNMAKNHGALVVAITNPTKNNLSDSKRKNYPSNEKLADHVRKSSLPDITIDANSLFSSSEYFGKDLVHLNKSAHNALTKKWFEAVDKRVKLKNNKLS